MKGNVIGFDPDTNTGAIAGYDGKRYDFTRQAWHGERQPQHGDLVDFLPEEDHAAEIYPIAPEYQPPSLGQFLFSPRGRLSRSQFWLRWFLPMTVIHIALWIGIVVGAVTHNPVTAGTFLVLWLLFSVATLWPSTAVLIKRMHDRNRTGWLVLAYYIPLVVQFVRSPGDHPYNPIGVILSAIIVAVGIWFLVEFGCLRGTIGGNRYGPDPIRQ